MDGGSAFDDRDQKSPLAGLRVADPVDPLALRLALGAFATGVTVVTAVIDGRPVMGMTVNSFNAVSLDPPLVLWSLRKSSASVAILRASSGFVVNVLSAQQHRLVSRFARPSLDKFDGIKWRAGQYGAVIEGSLAHFDCRHHAEYDAGDHLIFVGRVEAFNSGQGKPLVYWRGQDSAGMH